MWYPFHILFEHDYGLLLISRTPCPKNSCDIILKKWKSFSKGLPNYRYMVHDILCNFSKTTERGLQVFSERRYLFRLRQCHPVAQYVWFFFKKLLNFAENNPESYILGHAANARLISTGRKSGKPVYVRSTRTFWELTNYCCCETTAKDVYFKPLTTKL